MVIQDGPNERELSVLTVGLTTQSVPQPDHCAVDHVGQKEVANGPAAPRRLPSATGVERDADDLVVSVAVPEDGMPFDAEVEQVITRDHLRLGELPVEHEQTSISSQAMIARPKVAVGGRKIELDWAELNDEPLHGGQ
jgi:hypothetical protein